MSPKTAKTLGLAGRYIQVGAYGRTAIEINALRRLFIKRITANSNAYRARDAGFADAYVK